MVVLVPSKVGEVRFERARGEHGGGTTKRKRKGNHTCIHVQSKGG